MKLRYNAKGGITGRVGSDCRFASHEKGAKVKAGSDNFVVAHKDGKVHQKAEKEHVTESKKVYVKTQDPRVSVPWKLGDKKAEDGVPDDNE